MKRFAIRVVLHILLIVLLSIGSYLLFQKQLWFSTTYLHDIADNYRRASLPHAVQTNCSFATADRRTSL